MEYINETEWKKFASTGKAIEFLNYDGEKKGVYEGILFTILTTSEEYAAKQA